MTKVTIDRELLPCPFCGGEAELNQFTRTRWSVDCGVCGAAMISCANRQDAIDNWNRRAAQRQPEGEAASILLPALRQYMHNDGSGLLAGYEYERTQQIVAELREELDAAKEILERQGRNNTELRVERDTLRRQLAERDAEIERLRVKLMTIASAEPGRHNIEWAKAMAATGNNEPYAKWREAFDQRDKLAGLLREVRRMFDGRLESGQLGVLRGQTDSALAELK